MTMGSCVLSAAFVVFLVRERASRSKEVQCVSGAPLWVYWAATLAWDVFNYMVPLAGMLRCVGGRLCCAMVVHAVHVWVEYD